MVSREGDRRMKEDELSAMDEPDDSEMETVEARRAGASLMPSPTKAIFASFLATFSSPSGSPLPASRRRIRRPTVPYGRDRRGACCFSHSIFSAFCVGRTPAKTLEMGMSSEEATARAVSGLSPESM